MLQTDATPAQVLAACLQLLWQPVAPMGPFQRVRDALGMLQRVAQVLPNQLIQLMRGHVAGRAFFIPTGLDGIALRPTRVVVIARVHSPRDTTRLAHPTTNQCTEQVSVGFVVAAGERLVLSQLGLNRIELRLGDDRWDRGDRDPRLARRRDVTIVRMADRVGCRTSHARRSRPSAAGIDLTGIRRIGQNAANRGRIPAFHALRRREPQRLHTLGQPKQAGLIFRIPGEHLLDHGRFRLIHLHAGWIPGTIRVYPIAIWSSRPRQQDPRPQLGLTPAAHPFGNQRAFIFRHGPADLQQQLIMGIVTHRTVEKLNFATRMFKFFQQHHLLDIVARQPIGSRYQHAINFSRFDFVTQPIKARAIERRAAIAIIAENVLVLQFPTLALRMGPQPLELLFDGLGLCLALGRHAHIDRNAHRTPPASESNWGVVPARSTASIAEGTGRPDPIGAAHPAPVAACGECSTGVSFVPPR